MKIQKWFKVKCCNEIIKYSEFSNNTKKTHMSIRLALKKHLRKKHNNNNILEYYNEYYNKIEKCNFCNSHFAQYYYILSVNDINDVVFNNMSLLRNSYMCDNKICSHERSKLNSNSDIKISKKFNISLDEAKKYRIEHNKSSFYFHPSVDTIEEYKRRQSRSIDWYIKKYGEEEGIKKSKIHFNKISHANKKTTLIQKYGIDRANKISNSKKQTLDNFIIRYGEEEGKIRYTKWITTCTKSGEYINKGHVLSSKSSFKFFTNLTNMLIDDKLLLREDIIFADGHNTEYQIKYFNNENKLRWYYLDFVILSKKINVEFNGNRYHANPLLPVEQQSTWRTLYSNKTFNESIDHEIKRDNIVQSHGFTIFKVWDEEISTIEKYNNALNSIFNKIKERIINENIV